MRISGTERRTLTVALILAIACLVGSLMPAVVGAQTGTLFVEGDNVGIGTASPISSLHIVRNVAGAGTLLRLDNNGPARTTFNNTAAPSSWSFGHENNDRFTINRDGSGTQEFGIAPNGDVYLKNILIHSSRAVKTEFKPVDGVEILSKVVSLPIAEWQYRADAPGVRHIGPVAEDFHAIFSQGGDDDSRISLTDSTGIALAAIQGISHLLEEKDAELFEVKGELAARDAVIESLMERVASLEARVEVVEAQR